MEPAAPRPPKPFNGKPTLDKLTRWHEELMRYEAALRRWDVLNEDKEAMLNAWEKRLLVVTEAHQEQFEDEDDAAEYDFITQNDKDLASYVPPPVVNDLVSPMLTSDHISMKKIREEWSARMQLKPDVGTQKEIDWLDKLYALPDRRRKKKK